MVHHFLASPFDDAARANQFAAVRAALQRESAPDSLLLGNLVLEDGAEPIDALLVRPHSLTLLVLVPSGGRLSMPAHGHGRWLLSGGLPADAYEFDNLFEQLAQQKQAVTEWLRPRFSTAQVNLNAISGIVLFDGPVDFAPEATAALNSAPANFKLLPDAAALLPCLHQLASPEINLTEEYLREWTAEWAAFAAGAAEAAPAGPEAAAPPRAADALAKKARAFWGWLGAADVPDDPPYGVDLAAGRREEKQRLERLRQQMQADVAAQLQALEAREAERERSIAQLKAQLAQAPPVAATATALVSQIGAETREKEALEAQMEASRAESEVRNRELDAKIQQLTQLIERLNAQPAAPPIASPATNPAGPDAQPRDSRQSRPLSGTAFVSAATAARNLASGAQARLREQAGPRLRQLQVWGRRLPRLGLAAGAVALLGLGAWGIAHLDGSAPVPFQENGRWGFADAKGQPVIPVQFTAAKPFQNGRAVVAKAGAYGFVDEDGEETVAPAYDALNPYADGYARARVGDAYTFIDEAGEEFDSYYFNALDFAEGHAAVLDYRGWYYISGREEPEKPAIFKEAYSFVDGLARVRLADGFTYITPDYLDDPAEGTAPFGRYQHASDFADGRARVTQNGRTFLINKHGEEIK
ncbi:WG repeat-containing protein [Hymenobacter monticola]|uniref:WG repeat-containing protein n=1 Tax=Hymenobacter monticola TaxID=1705399 RepID=A0ABY4B328_9BACT|nr:WG repeat-containing protein [Hymenobacter monticola]UOE33545.1 WG repeat-containing protein [Hymenobacter monticola]